ncbi:2'-5' RNA ligase family protein [Streptomyces nigrescens]|uniref:2'-5' RNA ligase family protein n=1 Tax=Streptomyces nigrescens TaxID=1920 RepID=A0ABY7IYC8_STRNI|nr:2'-5' RNA ligase family protein [Streptomyces nigrescens]WAU04004.1 2'-5' RNA ligase family protein [Streptomyces nigrescens]
MQQLQYEQASFPPAPPPSLADPSVIAGHDWAAFGDVSEMVNHWDRPGWTASTRAYYWMITFPGASALIQRARQCQQALRSLAFDDIADDSLHLTLGRIGPSTEISLDQLDLLIASVQAASSSMSLQAVPMTASRGAIRFSVAPWTPLINLRIMLAEAGDSVGLPLRKPTSGFRPHIGISYCNRTIPAATVRDMVRPLRGLDAVEAEVQQVHIVELRREPSAYRWDVVRTLDLLREGDVEQRPSAVPRVG